MDNKKKEYLLLCHKVPQFGSGCVLTAVAQVAAFSVVFTFLDP